jgi:quercetin dioxygenase-like cupin family protein
VQEKSIFLLTAVLRSVPLAAGQRPSQERNRKETLGLAMQCAASGRAHAMSYFHSLEGIPAHAHAIGQIRLLSASQLMVFWADARAGTEAPLHSHPNEQITWLVEGRIDYQVGDEPVRSCGPGAIIVIPAGVPHHAWYREDCRIVEFFNPPRLDLFPAAANHPYGLA